MVIQKKILATVWLVSLVFVSVAWCSGENEHSFSLKHGTLTLAPLDLKAPEPGMVTARYGIRIAKDFVPYMGTGLAYSYHLENKPGDSIKIKAGVAGQAGFRYQIGTSSSLTLDYKYLYISPELTHSDSKSPPQSLGIGLDIHF